MVSVHTPTDEPFTGARLPELGARVALNHPFVAGNWRAPRIGHVVGYGTRTHGGTAPSPHGPQTIVLVHLEQIEAGELTDSVDLDGKTAPSRDHVRSIYVSLIAADPSSLYPVIL